MRSSDITRTTAETSIAVSLSLDGTGASEISTGSGFFDHMLTLFAKHGRFDLKARCQGDTQVDYHHSVEDLGICIGAAFAQAVGDGAGIARYGDLFLPMDETLVLAAVDISGRSFLQFDLAIPTEKVGDFDTQLVQEFFLAFTRKANITLHIKQFSGTNSHHIIEAAFKAVARALGRAVTIQADCRGEIPSTKGVL